VVVDATGRVWVSEFTAETITEFVPRTGRFRVHRLPGPIAGVRTMALDPRGRLWFVGSHGGTLGTIE
jgi:virginiamycin B lyase